jgi:hypothetical protein
MGCIHKTGHMGERKEEDKEGAKDEEEKDEAEERAVKEASERPSWNESGHEGEVREQVLSLLPAELPSSPALKKGGPT